MTTSDDWLRTRSIGSALAGGRDNFGLLRHLLALFVVVSHTASIGLTGLASSEIGYATTGLTLGEHSVNCFFAISGFLIAMSWQRRPMPLVYITSRCLRLFPGLIGAVFVTTFIIAASVTTLPFVDYLVSAETWQFVAEAIFRLKSTGTLPGVFRDNPLDIVLGTIWSLKYEIGCYFGLLVFGLSGLLLRPRVILCIAAIFGSGLLVIEVFAIKLSLSQLTGFRLRFIFSSAAAIYVWRDRVPLSIPAAGLAFCAALALQGTPLYHTALFAAETYLVLVLALAPALIQPALDAPFDFSYGIYLYGLPVQQAITALYHPLEPYRLLPLALCVTILFAAFSWYAIEAPALGAKRRLIERLPRLTLRFRRQPS